jgi:hypothetical protein
MKPYRAVFSLGLKKWFALCVRHSISITCRIELNKSFYKMNKIILFFYILPKQTSVNTLKYSPLTLQVHIKLGLTVSESLTPFLPSSNKTEIGIKQRFLANGVELQISFTLVKNQHQKKQSVMCEIFSISCQNPHNEEGAKWFRPISPLNKPHVR